MKDRKWLQRQLGMEQLFGWETHGNIVNDSLKESEKKK